MKINYPTRWGIIFALLSTPVTSQVNNFCSLVRCASGTYCNEAAESCLEYGKCVDPADCGNPSNGPYAMNMCMGAYTCEDKTCGIACGEGLEDPTQSQKNPNDTQISPDKLKCTAHSDCPNSGESNGEYCAADGFCERMGGCATPDDCWVDENQGYPIALCMGSMMCTDRKCEMNCSGGSDALFGCETAKDCPEPGDYCNTYEFCRPSGYCNTDEDCSLPDNMFMEIECVGTRYCDEYTGMCGKECDSEPVKTGGLEPMPSCTSSEDCPTEGEYCAGKGICLGFGSCDREADCTRPDNEIFLPSCVGTITCESGQCGKTCDEEPMPSCTSSEDCPTEGEYCAGNGICLGFGSCDREADCTRPDNEIFLPFCVGTVTCESGQCGKTCDEVGNGSEVVIDVISCATDNDCNSISTSTTRQATIEDKYCAQGVCTEQGSCFSDEDCINSSNILWGDKKCFGYLHCNEEGLCDRVCGEDCKNGSKAAECFANQCDVEDWSVCEGAVSCSMTTCDGECNTVLFNAAGEVLADCAVAPVVDNTKVGGESDKDKPKATDTTPATEEANGAATIEDLNNPWGDDLDGTESQILNIESSAVRATSIFAILAAFLVAATF